MTSSVPLNGPLVSKLQGPLPCFIRDFFAYRDDGHDPETNPDGALFFSVSEDTYASSITAEQITRDNVAFPLDPHVLEYTFGSGMLPTRRAASQYLSQYVFGLPANEKNICMVDGCGSAVGLIAQMIAEPGEGIMLLAPHYRGFLDDLLRAYVEVVIVPTESKSEFRVSEQAFETAVREAKEKRGITCKALLISSPNNPLGTIYSREELLDMVAWVRRHNMHFIVDEIYAQSVFGEQTFQSIYQVLDGELGDDVHVLYGFGKDLGMCGLRTGLVYTQNAVLNRSMPAANLITQMSNQTQTTLVRLIENKAWLEDLFSKRCARLARVCRQICAALDQNGVPYIKPCAGFFIYCDLSAHCHSQTFAAELELYDRLVSECKIILTPGSYMNASEPGWFRIVYSNSTDSAVDAFCARLFSFLSTSDKALNHKAP